MSDDTPAVEPSADDEAPRTGVLVQEGSGPEPAGTAEPGAAPGVGADEAEAEPGAVEADEQPLASPIRITLAAMLGSAAAAWMLSGPFEGPFAKVVALAGVMLAGGLVAASYRWQRPTPLQLSVMPVALVASAGLIAAAGAEPGRMIDLVTESLRTGGLADPPVPFDPGWQVLVVLISAFLTVTAATSAVVLDQPRLAVLVAGAVALVALLFQPPGEELAAVIVALVLAVGGLAVAYGADLARDGTISGSFELRRLLRAGGMSVSLIAVMVVLGQVGFLVPETAAEQPVPPRRPDVSPPQGDRVLFTVETDVQLVPWRIGVLDVYADNAWMTPPFLSSRLADLSGGEVATAVTPELAAPGAIVGDGGTQTATFTLEDVEGRVVPLLPGVTEVTGDLAGLRFNPRTQTLLVNGRQPRGTSYTVTAVEPPDGEELAEASKVTPDDPALAEFLEAPEPPRVAEALIAEAAESDDTSPFAQLQHVRTTLYEEVIAAGAGDPIDVPPARVDQMLEGGEATPYEIVAAEALLARWVGLPARVGYGYFGGEDRSGVIEVRPRHGAMWLEVHFDDLGWVPIVGRPVQAKASLSDQDRNEDENLVPTDEIAAQVFVPTASSTLSPIYLLVRHWLARVLPLVVGIVVLLGGYPVPVKLLRRWRRRRWADTRGPKARVAVSYGEIRDLANDLNIGHPTLTPIEFLDAVEPDAEHRELAWLVTRTMWGDLQRDTTDVDAIAAEEIARSFRKRFSGGQTYIARVLAAVSRVSLKQPFDPELPNLWWSARQRPADPLVSAAGRARALRAGVRALARWLRQRLEQLRRFGSRLRRRLPARVAMLVPRRLPRPRLRFVVPGATVMLVVLAIVVTGGVQRVDLTTPASFEVPQVPEEIADYRFEPFDKAQQAYDAFGLESLLVGGTFYGIRHEGVIVGSFQQSAFKPGPRDRGEELQSGMLRSLLMGPDDLVRLGGEKVYVRRVPEQTQYLWLAPDLSTFQLMIATRDLRDADAMFAALLAIQRGEEVTSLELPEDTPPLDPRRGAP